MSKLTRREELLREIHAILETMTDDELEQCLILIRQEKQATKEACAL